MLSDIPNSTNNMSKELVTDTPQMEQTHSVEPDQAPQIDDTGSVNVSEPASDEATLLASIEAQLAAERARADELLEKSQRLSAEFQNARRRQEKQLTDEIERANTYLIKRLLPVVDDFDLAFANVPAELDSGAPWVEGFRQIQKKLQTLLEEENIAPIPPDGEFDPVLHEAIMSEPSDSVPSGYLIATLRKGYTHKGRTLRPAMVRVAL